VKKTFRELKSGAKSWSEITREDWQFFEAEKRCIYCGSESDLHKEHIVPKSLEILPKCISRGYIIRYGLAADAIFQKGQKGCMSFIEPNIRARGNSTI